MTAPPRRPVVLVCQTFLAAAAVAAVSLPAVDVVQLDIVEPGTHEGAASGGSPSEASMVSTAPVAPTVEEVELESGAVRKNDDEYAVLTRPVGVDGYATVGVTWDSEREWDEDEITLSVRTLHEGEWSMWEEMHYDPHHMPDPGGPEAEAAARPGTDAVVVGEVDKVQVRARTSTGEAPDDVELSIVDPGVEQGMELQAPEHGSDDAALEAGDATRAAQLTAGTPDRPTIFSRSQWGANESLRDGSPRYGTVNAGFVHHTVNSNGYSREQVPSIIRGIYAYHTQSRGWSDVGYNFLVDRFGRIWEGRYGGVARPVIGAHTLGYNEYSFAMSAIGNFDTTSAPQAMLDAYAKLFAWKLALHGVQADSTRQRVGSGYFQAINGHRDAGQTACPGRYLYAKVPDIRSAAARIQRSGSTPTVPKAGSNPVTNLSGSQWPDIPVRAGDGSLTVTRTEGQLRFERSVTARKGWAGMDLLAAPGDLTGDRHGDVIARDPQARTASLYAGDGNGGVGAPVAQYARFNGLDQLVGAADFDGDGHGDLVGRVDRSGALRLYPGLGGGAIGKALTLAPQWDYDLTVGPGDVDGDGRPDLLARRDGRMYFLKGLRSRLGTAVQLPGSWGRFDVVTGRGDVTRDGRPDVLARVRSSKLTYVYPGDGAGGFGKAYGPFVAFRGMSWFAVGGNLKRGPGVDALGVRASTGALKVVGHTGRRNVGRTVDTGTDLPAVDSLLPVGDWNRDGHGDLMYRERSSGRLMFLAGRGKDDYAAPVVAASGFGGVTGLVGGGDLTGDGRMDLLGEDADGVVRVYPGDGTSGVGSGFSARSGTAASAGKHHGVVHRGADGVVRLWRLSGDGGPMTSTKLADDGGAYDWFHFLGDVDGVAGPDVLARAEATGRLFMLPVTSNGLGARRYVGDELAGTGFSG